MPKDLFSGHADQYAAARPHYPESLYKFLTDLVPEHQFAWDCATGSGQAAVALSQYFTKVLATDLSPQQLEHAIKKPNIEYKVMLAEHADLPDSCVDLVTVAQAVHWFDIEVFFQEV